MMTTEEMIQEQKPLTLELEYAEAPVGREEPSTSEHAASTQESVEHASKKEQILKLYEGGTTDIAEIVRQVKARPSYVAQVLQTAGHLTGYFDLYTTTSREQNVYTRFFRNVLSFKSVEAARESVQKIDRLYNYFERLGDRAGQHQAMVLALTGKNRARWSGKLEEAQIFSEWLAAH
jgi:flagellin-specific chaperone FliS